MNIKVEAKDRVRKPIPKTKKLANSAQSWAFKGGNVGSDPTMITRVACITKACQN